jgi:hypothetical protein
LATWRELLTEEMDRHGETFACIQSITLTDSQLDRWFDDGFGGAEGEPFTAWTARRVYFPTEYDGAEDVGSVSRHPDGKPTQHI